MNSKKYTVNTFIWIQYGIYFNINNMITIIEWNSRQQFESKKLASEYFKIPVTLIDKSLKLNKGVTCKNNKRYKFSKSWSQDGQSRILKTPRSTTMPFGKYKGKNPKDIPLNYLVWMYKQENCPWCVKKALKDLKELIK